eukprot:768616-Amphidinium_carterae.1
MLLSAPSALYSSLQAIPGFLGMSRSVEWFASRSVSAVTAVLTSIGMPVIATKLYQTSASGVNENELLVLGKSLVVVVIPTCVTLVCHAECLGGWVFFWKPCVDFDQSMGPHSVVTITYNTLVTHQRIVSRPQICGFNINVK